MVVEIRLSMVRASKQDFSRRICGRQVIVLLGHRDTAPAHRISVSPLSLV